jgi:hypothetical protein
MRQYYDIFDNFLSIITLLPQHAIPMPSLSYQLQVTLFHLHQTNCQLVDITHPNIAPTMKQQFNTRVQYITFVIHSKCNTLPPRPCLRDPRMI